MQPEATEWVEIAEADFRTATREAAAIEAPNFSAVCFHAQQSAEKYLKALLVEHDIYFPKTHHLPMLAGLLQRAKIDIEGISAELPRLTPYGIDVRYPGGRPDAEEAKQALSDCTAARSLLRGLLGLPL
jgi:HEPN domain-containing protein